MIISPKKSLSRSEEASWSHDELKSKANIDVADNVALIWPRFIKYNMTCGCSEARVFHFAEMPVSSTPLSLPSPPTSLWAKERNGGCTQKKKGNEKKAPMVITRPPYPVSYKQCLGRQWRGHRTGHRTGLISVPRQVSSCGAPTINNGRRQVEVGRH